MLAVACAFLGLASPWAISIISRAAASLDPAHFAPIPAGVALGGFGLASVQPIALATVGLAATLAIYEFLRRRGRTRTAQTWACGQGSVDGSAEYTATAFANPIKRIFSNLYQFERTTEPVDGVAPYFVTRWRTHSAIEPLFERFLYRPAVSVLQWTSRKLARWSSPGVNFGLVLFAGVVAVLLWWAM
jgi:hypothetical protein